MNFTNELKNRVLKGYRPGEEEALRLAEEDPEILAQAAVEIREHFCGSRFHLCAIVSAKSGECGENCKFCAQSCRCNGRAEQYGMLPPDKMAENALTGAKAGIERFAFVTSGRTLTDAEVDRLCDTCRRIREQSGIGLCSSNGLLNRKQLERLHKAGISRYHCNLETSRSFFPKICTSHTYDEKIQTLKNAAQAGMQLCSGGIIGMGETMRDRIEMALTLRDLGVASVPVNVLNPIPGTPLEKQPRLPYTQIQQTISVFRFLLPSAEIRFAGRRILLPDKGRQAICSGLNAVISGDMLTTRGIGAKDDADMAKSLGFAV
jgi:biotin synthase